MTARRAWQWGWLAGLVLLLSACAMPPKTAAPPGVPVWTGRLALTVEEQASQSFSAGFELKGSAEQGELSLFNPLGGTVAMLAWSPGNATLRANGSTRQFPSLDALAREATGQPLPVGALFDWLAGTPTAVEGWEPDLRQVAQGRLQARRTAPPPAADLRVVFER